MSRRARWWVASLLPGAILLAVLPVHIAARNWSAVILAITGAIITVTGTLRCRWLYKAGWYAGRVSMHLDVHDIDPEPWHDVPPRIRVPRTEYPESGDSR